ncbi:MULTISPECIES: MmpS family transport accessory protein [Chryseobacterium]|jgi:hypothetical protein|uniref:Membrane protein n=1 Tax=Chryseobacterium balustinum TaxID=246 RepID=A0AAX2IK51_9FLAO|nr:MULTISPECIES: MmpS family transport accessory protein [Chryseobacterium]AZB30382.1 hypothetical protein EB354_14580 [Chryseobacterium balustinum]SKB46730.1 membrane protein [Chryseobacterium balustinum]SQA89216.1 Uncharacterised protein [Chryseobacterium balustinum]
MKKMKLKNVLKGSFVMVMAALVFGFVTSCSNNDDDDNIPGTNKTHKVVFKAEASAGSNIEIAVYGIDGNPTTATSLSGTTWSSPEITTEAGAMSANVAINAVGASTSSTLKVQIWVDGELKKEGTSSGQYLSASASHTF